MKYFFVLGANPTLSLAELTAVFSGGRFSLAQKNIIVLESGQEIKSAILKKIGGIIKFGSIHNRISSLAVQDILKAITVFSRPERIETKFKFGFSHYGKSKINLEALGMEFKKLLKQAGINSRWVISREPTLSSVVVEQNKLISDRGVEIIIIEFNKKLFLGKTLAVQPFKELSFRDYGRPARNDRSGMLPPKLAQIMINLSGANNDSVILDPFCGSGTIITEAMLLGYNQIIGADISNRAISDTKKNVEWIKKNYKLQITKYKIQNSDSTKISKHIAPDSIDVIITEPYLGPQRGKIEVNKIKLELEKLYSDSLREFHKILKPSGRVVMIWPVFQMSLRGNDSDQSNLAKVSLGAINPNLNSFTIINPIPKSLRKNIFLKLTGRGTVIYGREGQKVWREIVVLEK